MSEWAVPGYTALKPLGSGGFGSVVLAMHDATGTPVAIKYLLSTLRHDLDFAAMFRAEAVALGALDDPHVVRLYEYVESAAGAAIVMELVDGVTLWDILSRHGKTTPEAALVVLFGSLLGLAAAHARGVVHRDYKPRNVLVNAYGASKLTDFGIAARAGTPTIPSGSVAYSPPEQFDGSPASPASDVYAATATFYECLTGRPPFTGTTVDTVIEQHRFASVPMDPVPGPLRPIVARGMAKDPRYRPSDAAALAAELRAAAIDGYGPDWEQRGRSQLGETALLLALLWPSAGVPALQGYTVEHVRLSQGAQHAHGAQAAQHAHAAQAAQHAQAAATRGELHRWHLRHILHRDHLAHLRYLRQQRAEEASSGHPGAAGSTARRVSRAARRLRVATAGVTAAAVIAAGVTVALTSRPGHAAANSSAGHAAVSVYPVTLATIPLTATSSRPAANGHVYVLYNGGSAATAQLSGEISNAPSGGVAQLYAQQFPFTGAPVPAGSVTLSPADGGGSYTFQVTPTIATRYQVRLLSSVTATVPLAESAVTTIYVVASFVTNNGTCSGSGVCQLTITDVIYQPPSTLAAEMAKRWYVYVGPSQASGSPPQYVELDPNAVVSSARQTAADSYTRTISLSYNTGSSGGTPYFVMCFKDTEAQDGTGIPNATGCGDQRVLSAAYIG